MGVGGMVLPTYTPYIFLTDGTLTSDFSVLPDSAEALAAWRRKAPGRWGVWKQAGETITIRWNDPRRNPEIWKKWFVAKPADEGMRLTGKYRAMGGDVMVSAWSEFVFSADGTLTTGGGSGVSSGGGGSGTSVVGGSRRGPEAARYQLSGYGLTITRAGDAKEVLWFFRFPDSDKAIGIGSRVYALRR